MAAIVLTLSVTALVAGPTLAVKVRAACEQLGIAESGLTVPAALKACNEAMGIEASGPLLAQADELVNQLGISIDTLVPRPPAAPPATPSKADLAALDARVAAALQPPPPPPRPREQQPAMPKMVVFDLDFTLWRPELYQLSSGSPFKACSDGAVLTSRGERLDLFPAARTALRTLADAHVPVAIASRANEVAWAHEIMRRLRVDDRRTVADVVGSAPVVIQGGSKVAHLKHIASESGVSLRDMLFFDNERTNIVQVEKIGPTCVYCPRGMTDTIFAEGVSVHVANRPPSSPRRRPAAAGAADGREDHPRGGGRGRKGGRKREEGLEVGGRRKKDRGKRRGRRQ